jgi:ferritin-like metal-binding protein YciE
LGVGEQGIQLAAKFGPTQDKFEILEEFMPVKTAKEMFVVLLSDVLRGSEKATQFYKEVGQLAEAPEIKEALEARALISEGVVTRLNKCFKLLDEQPVKFTGRLQEVFIEDFRRELAEIQSPVAKKIFFLAKLVHLTQLRIGEYMALIAAADTAGNYGVGVLLESCLAEKLAFVERTRRLIRHVVETKVAERAATASV